MSSANFDVELQLMSKNALALLIGVTLLGCSHMGAEHAFAKKVATVQDSKRFSRVTAVTDRERTARSLLDAMDRGDVGALLALSHPDERRLMHLTPGAVQALVDLYNREKEGMHPVGVSECGTSGGSGYLCTEILRSKNQDVGVSGFAFTSSKGVYALVTQSLMHSIEHLRWSRITGSDVDNETPAEKIVSIKWLAGELGPKGIPGLMFFDTEGGDLKLMTWKAFLDRAEFEKFHPKHGSLRAE